jgi:Niemann-Pick C2 protein
MSAPVSLMFLGITALLVCQSESKAVNLTDCGSQEGKIVKFDITPCDSDPCNLKRGTHETGTLTFIALEYITSLHLKVWAIIDGLNIPVQIPSDACHNYGLTCPIHKGQTVQLVIKEIIQSDFPTGKLSMKMELIDPERKIICFVFPIVIT